MLRVSLALLAVGAMVVLGSVASAGIIVTVTQQPDPYPGLSAYILTATADAPELNVAALREISVSDVHQVWENIIATPTDTTPDISELSGTFWKGAWGPLDTHLLIDPDAANVSKTAGFGQTETNSGLNEAGLTTGAGGILEGPNPFQAFPGVAGMGSYAMTPPVAEPQLTLLAPQPHSIDFLYVVQPTGTTTYVHGYYVDSTASAFHEITTPVGVIIPEPASITLAGLAIVGLVGLVRRRR